MDNKDYISRLKRARRRRRGGIDPKVPAAAAGGILVIILLFFSINAFFNKGEEAGAEPPESTAQTESPAAGETLPSEPVTEPESTQSPEEIARQQHEQTVDAVIAAYSNLGLVQVNGYLNVRETPGSSGKIIGKLSGNSACEVLETEGEWSKITSGGIEGYIHNQYVLTGDEARQAAREFVKPMAVVKADKLNIRETPDIDPANITGQALINERYEVVSEEGEWIRIAEGYLFGEYAEVRYALNEARKLDLKAMALSQYDNLVISKVNNFLNVRAEPKSDGKIIGKMTSKAAGEILETLDGWYKIRSGNITGYISADASLTATGQEAKDIALETATLMAIVNTDMLNVRTEPSTESTIWTQISKLERFAVVEQLDGWVEIEMDTEDSDKAYISTRDNNVEVRYALAEAIKFSPVEEAAMQAASTRSQLVNYAVQFVGNPYVWGGTSLTKGADCSGFTMQIMKKYGVSLPHYSVSQSQMGKAVSQSEMRPGDLVFYTNSRGVVNHVAIYIGNGQVVHAASRRSGIKISTWNYRRPKTIRNVLGD